MKSKSDIDPKLRGDEIRQIRTALGESQAEFADRFEVDQSTISRWEKGRALPDFRDVLSLYELAQSGGLPFHLDHVSQDERASHARLATQLRNALGWTIEEMAEASNVTEDSVRRWESAKVDDQHGIDANMWENILTNKESMMEDILEHPPALELIREMSKEYIPFGLRWNRTLFQLRNIDETRLIPILTVGSAPNIQFGLGTDNNIHISYVSTDTLHSEKSFAIRVRDNSMMPELGRGDLAIFDPAVQPLPGDIIIARFDNEIDAIIRVYRDRGRDDNGCQSAELAPLNIDWPIAQLDPSRGRIVGTLIESRRYHRHPPPRGEASN